MKDDKDKACEEIVKAYLKMKEFMQQNPENPILAEEALKNLSKYMDQWDGCSDIPEDLIWGKGPDAFSSIGNGIQCKQNFFEYMKDRRTKEIIKELNDLRINQPMNFRLVNPIYNAGLLEYLKNYCFESGYRPHAAVGRVLNMMYPKLFTTISDEKKTCDVAKLLGIQDWKNLSFVHLQYHIRSKVKDCLKRNQLTTEGDYREAAIAYFIVEK